MRLFTFFTIAARYDRLVRRIAESFLANQGTETIFVSDPKSLRLIQDSKHGILTGFRCHLAKKLGPDFKVTVSPAHQGVRIVISPRP